MFYAICSIASVSADQLATPAIGSSVTLTVNVSGSNPLTYQWKKNAVSISGAVAETYTIPDFQLSDAGNYTVVVRNSFGITTSDVATLAVPQTITFGALAARTFGDASFTLGGTASSGLAVSYTSSNPAVATVTGNTVTIVGAGSTTITANQAGNGTYSAAPSVPQTLTVNKAAPIITWPAPADIYLGTPLSSTQLNAIASVAGTFTYLPAVGAILESGTQELSVTFTPTDSVNYSSGIATTTLFVNAVPPRPVTFDAAGYLASNPDVAAVIGGSPASFDAAWEHYFNYGIAESRTDGDFNVRAYLSQYADLAAIYGSDLKSAAMHWYTEGRAEGLRIPEGFDVNGYFARNLDIAALFADDRYGAWLHFLNYGMQEGRTYDLYFRVDEYLELNTDLKAAFGTDRRSALLHWLTYGRPIEDRMGRVPIGFDVDSYLARYPDLAAFFAGITPVSLRNVTVWNHYLAYGVAEGRSDGDFVVSHYLATNPDLAAAFGSNLEMAALHWYIYGRREGRRIPAPFDVQEYQVRNPDVVVVFGNDLYGTWLHYRDIGVHEGRVYGDDFRPEEYLERYPDLLAVFGADLEAALIHWMYYGKAEGRIGRL